MKTSRYSDPQILLIPRQAAGGMPALENNNAPVQIWIAATGSN